PWSTRSPAAPPPDGRRPLRRRARAACRCSACRGRRRASCPRPPSRRAPGRTPRRPPHRAATCRPSRGPRAGIPLARSSSVLPVLIVPAPPLVGWALRISLRRVLPSLLPPEPRGTAQAPGGADHLEAAAACEVGAIDVVTLAEEGVEAEHLAVLVLA